jgi:N-acetylglucosaminyl-diphospho-decaprenol L-rhamnosyltransferase
MTIKPNKDKRALPDITISIVSHRQGKLVHKLLLDIHEVCPIQNISVLLTINIEEHLPFQEKDFPFPVKILRNRKERGFGANHNRALRGIDGAFYCIMNPDVRLEEDPFRRLCSHFLDKSKTGLVAPVVLNPESRIEDSARCFPTFRSLLLRNIIRKKAPDYEIGKEIIFPDWVAGMFLFIPKRIFEEMEGFDERYFLYFEDVDLCARLRLAGYAVLVDPAVRIFHDAGRKSHFNIKHLVWHVTSMIKYFNSPACRALRKLPKH